MANSFLRTEGVILRVIPYGDYDQIIILFTRDAGVVKVFYKGSRSKRMGVQGICLPLTCVEIVYQENKGEIFPCREMTLVHSNQSLKKQLNHLNAACDLLHAVSASQLPGKAAPLLYSLLLLFLARIPSTSDPWMLAVSFRLKLLMHEGLMTIPFLCNECGSVLSIEGYCSVAADWMCAKHRVSGCHYWSGEELQMLYRLGSCQNYREIADCTVTQDIKEKTLYLFEGSLAG